MEHRLSQPIWASRSYRYGTGSLRNPAKRVWTEAETRYIEERYERDINTFGCSLRELHSA